MKPSLRFSFFYVFLVFVSKGNRLDFKSTFPQLIFRFWAAHYENTPIQKKKKKKK